MPVKRSISWLLLCAVHAVCSMLLWWTGEGPLEHFIWRVDTWLAQPWTLWTSAWVHLNTPQLILNQFLLGVLTAFAWVVRPSRSATLAWWLAWPLAQAGLVAWPQIGYAVGLAGVLHAGAMVLAVQLLMKQIAAPHARRWGALLGGALLLELLLERPWSYPVVWDSGNERSVVQAVHLTSVLAGASLSALLSLPALLRSRRTRVATVAPAAGRTGAARA